MWFSLCNNNQDGKCFQHFVVVEKRQIPAPKTRQELHGFNEQEAAPSRNRADEDEQPPQSFVLPVVFVLGSTAPKSYRTARQRRPAGFDRAAFHCEFHSSVVRFFRERLRVMRLAELLPLSLPERPRVTQG